jgi:hypothetical protein
MTNFDRFVVISSAAVILGCFTAFVIDGNLALLVLGMIWPAFAWFCSDWRRRDDCQ